MAALTLLALFLPRTARSSEAPASHPERDYPVAPELPDGHRWLNSAPLKMRALRGKVVLIDFWEYTCINCIRTFPYLKAWHERYRDKGLVIIGVHTPEFRFAREEAHVARAAREFGLTWPLVLDSEYRIWNSYGNRYWPAKYLIDRRGRVRYYHFGEGAYGHTEQRIQELLREINPRLELPSLLDPIRGADRPGAVCYPVTPELYLGYERGSLAGMLGNHEGYRPNRTVHYRDPGRHQDGLFYLNGAWKNLAEAVLSVRASTRPRDWIAIRYRALEVNIVARPTQGKPVRVWVFQDGKPLRRQDAGADVRYARDGRSYLWVSQPRMYNVVKNAQYGEHGLKLIVRQPGLAVYTFTFVSCAVNAE